MGLEPSEDSEVTSCISPLTTLSSGVTAAVKFELEKALILTRTVLLEPELVRS